MKTVQCANGERLPTLINSLSGIPDFDATLWVTSTMRGKGAASATIEQSLRSIIVLYKVLRSNQIDLTTRLSQGYFITPSECESILDACKLKSKNIINTIHEHSVEKINSRQIINLEKFRANLTSNNHESHVSGTTVSIRMGYIRSFLKWRCNQEIFRSVDKLKTNLIQLRDLVDDYLKCNTPNTAWRSIVNNRIGINDKQQELLKNVMTFDGPQNPWKNDFVKTRNQVIVNALLSLGIRRGELLGLQVNDLKPQWQEIHILRRPDNNQDTRLDEPNTKTRDRVLPLSNELYEIIKVYLILRHEIVRGSHNILITAINGDPLTKSGIKRVFDDLKKVPEISCISPHILRHTFFENLAIELHRNGIGDIEILSYLRQQGGWSHTSETPHRYIKRFAQERANEAMMSLQKKLLIDSRSED